MEIQMNLNGKSRRELAEAIGEILGETTRYAGAPSFRYEVGELYSISRGSKLVVADEVPVEDVVALATVLPEWGFDPVRPEAYAEDEDDAETGGSIEEPDLLTVLMPLEGFDAMALQNLRRLVDSKTSLLSKALGRDSLMVGLNDKEDTLCFPWLRPDMEPEEVRAYTQLIAALCEMAKRQKRVIAEDKVVENEKYAMRCFLLRLGFIGVEYAEARRILLRNLSGNGSWKYGEPQQKRQAPETTRSKAKKAHETQEEVHTSREPDNIRFSLKKLLRFRKR